MTPKALFFDIDGTIWDFHNNIPPSCREGIRMARENGHLAFLCTGRARGFVTSEDLLSIGFDGIVSGCGTMIEYRGEVLYQRLIEKDLVIKTMEEARKYRVRPILEGPRHLYMDYEDFKDDRYGQKLMREMEDSLLSITDSWGKWEIVKLACDLTGSDTAPFVEALSPWYDFIFHNEIVVEMVPKGFSKATGIHKTCSLLGLDITDTFAFGDGQNDMEMIRAAGCGIAMGNATPALKAAADYVTSALDRDGLWNALCHFGLIPGAMPILHEEDPGQGRYHLY